MNDRGDCDADMIAPESRLVKSAAVLTQEVSGTLVLLRPDDGQYYALDEVGSRVWSLCTGTRSVAELVDTICQEFDAPAERVTADVMGLLRELADERLVGTTA